MPTTPTWQLPYPAEVDPADVPLDMQELCNRLDTVLSQLKSGGAIPGEVRMWSGAAVPDLATYGRWAWADGSSYVTATFPVAAANIAPAWRTHGGKADPGGANFRVPDLRGSAPVGMDAMPGGARANRIARAAAATLAAVTGEEYHALALAETPAHGHGVSDPTHAHGVSDPGHQHWMSFAESGSGAGTSHPQSDSRAAPIATGPFPVDVRGTGIGIYGAGTGITIQNAGGGGAHENLPPATFVPYIVKLDD